MIEPFGTKRCAVTGGQTLLHDTKSHTSADTRNTNQTMCNVSGGVLLCCSCESLSTAIALLLTAAVHDYWQVGILTEYQALDCRVCVCVCVCVCDCSGLQGIGWNVKMADTIQHTAWLKHAASVCLFWEMLSVCLSVHLSVVLFISHFSCS